MSSRAVILKEKTLRIAGINYQVPTYIRRRLGANGRDGWTVNVEGLVCFYADADSSTAEALQNAKGCLHSIITLQSDFLFTKANIVVKVEFQKDSVSHCDVFGYFINIHGVPIRIKVCEVPLKVNKDTVMEFSIHHLPGWLQDKNFQPVFNAWLQDFRLRIQSIFQPDTFKDCLSEAVSLCQTAKVQQLSLSL